MPDIGRDLQLAYEEGFHDGYNQALMELDSLKQRSECRAPRDIMLSLHAKWFNPIMTQVKVFEVRKRAPAQKPPFKVYLYCTAERGAERVAPGKVCGEFVCTEVTECSPPFHGVGRGTCMTDAQIAEYADGRTVSLLLISAPTLYKKPKDLLEFGLARAPQSWCYLKRNLR